MGFFIKGTEKVGELAVLEDFSTGTVLYRYVLHIHGPPILNYAYIIFCSQWIHNHTYHPVLPWIWHWNLCAYKSGSNKSCEHLHTLLLLLKYDVKLYILYHFEVTESKLNYIM